MDYIAQVACELFGLACFAFCVWEGLLSPLIAHLMAKISGATSNY